MVSGKYHIIYLLDIIVYYVLGKKIIFSFTLLITHSSSSLVCYYATTIIYV